MSVSFFARGIVTVLATVLIASPFFLLSPQRVHAQAVPGVPIMSGGPLDFIDAIKATLSEIHQYTSMVADVANYVNTYVLQPLAFIMSGQLMKALTQSVIKFAIGKANGTGIPQFTVDVQKSLRSISDFKAQAYFRQVSLTNSPFATSIAQALGVDYNQKTSLAGYWAANMSTLGQNIPTYNQSYLNGNWAAGGVAAWFQLTTQSQNNPYTFYQSAQAKLGSVIGNGAGGVTGARLSQLSWGQGFMSWCDPSTTAAGKQSTAQSVQDACIQNGGSPSYCDHVYSDAGGADGGVNPGDPCTDKDGNAGTIATPGSTIKATLDKVLGGQQDKLVQIGNISTQVNQILGDVGTVFNTINLAANILGGSNSSGGLLGAASSGGALNPPTKTVPPINPNSLTYLGSTGSQVNQGAASSAVTAASNTDTASAVNSVISTGLGGASGGGSGSTASDMPGRVQQYTKYWNAIAAAANDTKAALQAEMTACHAYYGGTSQYETDAQNAISFEVTPVLTQAAGIKAITDAALAQNTLVQGESTSASTYQADLQKLNTMTPTASDVSKAQYDATAYGGATANPAGSLTVSGSSIVDQMNLIKNNAASIQSSSCTQQDTGGGGA